MALLVAQIRVGLQKSTAAANALLAADILLQDELPGVLAVGVLFAHEAYETPKERMANSFPDWLSGGSEVVAYPVVAPEMVAGVVRVLGDGVAGGIVEVAASDREANVGGDIIL